MILFKEDSGISKIKVGDHFGKTPGMRDAVTGQGSAASSMGLAALGPIT
jgi:hypothetical protein